MRVGTGVWRLHGEREVSMPHPRETRVGSIRGQLLFVVDDHDGEDILECRRTDGTPRGDR